MSGGSIFVFACLGSFAGSIASSVVFMLGMVFLPRLFGRLYSKSVTHAVDEAREAERNEEDIARTRVLATITDEQLAKLEAAGFSFAQIHAMRQARAAGDLRALIKVSGTLGAHHYEAIFSVLTEPQIEALADAVQSGAIDAVPVDTQSKRSRLQ